jgi:hypothetical protein
MIKVCYIYSNYNFTALSSLLTYVVCQQPGTAHLFGLMTNISNNKFLSTEPGEINFNKISDRAV